MAFDFKLSLRVSSGPSVPERGVGMSDGWAKRKLQQLAEREESAKEKTSADLLERQQVLAEAPLLWQKLKDEFSDNIATFNSAKAETFRLETKGAPNSQDVFISTQHGHIKIAYYFGVPQITIEHYSGRAATIEAGLDKKIEYSFRIYDREALLYVC